MIFHIGEICSGSRCYLAVLRMPGSDRSRKTVTVADVRCCRYAPVDMRLRLIRELAEMRPRVENEFSVV